MAGSWVRDNETTITQEPVVLERMTREDQETAREAALMNYSAEEVYHAGMRMGNSLVSHLAEERHKFAPVEGYDPTKDWRGYEDYAEDLVGIQSPEEMTQAKANIDRERADRKLLQLAGGYGTMAEMAGVLSDPLLLPLWLMPPMRIAASVGKLGTAARYSAAATAETAVHEAALHSTQMTRTTEETLYALGGAALLGAAVGGIVGRSAGVASRTPEDSAAYNADNAANVRGDIEAPGLSAQRAVDREQLDVDIDVWGDDYGVKDPRLTSAFAWISPLGRVATSQSPTASGVAASLVESAYQFVGRTRDFLSEGAVETVVRSDVHESLKLNYMVQQMNFTEYKKAGGQMGRDQFFEEVGYTLFTGDKHANPVIQRTVEQYRARYDEFKQALLDEGLVSESQLARNMVDPTYMHRMYHRDNLIENKDQFIQLIKEHVLNTSAKRNAEAKIRRGKRVDSSEEVLDQVRAKEQQALEEAEAELSVVQRELEELKSTGGTQRQILSKAKRLARAESKVAKAKRLGKGRIAKAERIRDRAVTRAKQPAEVLTDVDAEDVARELHGKLVFRNAPMDLEAQDIVGRSGPLQERALMIPSKVLADNGFLVTNAADVLDVYTHKVAPQIRLQQRYGSVDMKAQIDAITEEYTSLIANADTPKAANKLVRERDRVVKDVQSMRDVIRGVYRSSYDPSDTTTQVLRNVRALETLNSLGGVLAASIVDAAIPIARYGLRNTLKGVAHTVRNMDTSVEMAQRANGALDNALHNRIQSLLEPGEFTQPRHLRDHAMRGFGQITGLSWWNTTMKSVVSNMAQDSMLRHSVALADGTITREGREILADLGITDDMARQFASQPIDRGRAWVADTTQWTDTAAVQRFHTAMLQQMDTNVLVPGAGDVPLWARSEWGKTIAQFKSFVFAAHNRLLMPALQRRDRRAAEAIMGTLALATLSNTLREVSQGKSPEEWTVNTDPSKAALDAMSYSGFVGLLMEPYSIMKYSQGQIHQGLAGPALGSGLRDMNTALGMPSSIAEDGTPTEAQIKAARRLAPYQNLIWFRWLIDKMEEGVIEATGADE